MASLFDLNSFDLKELSIQDYFKTIESTLEKTYNVDKLTNFFTVHPFSEWKSYLNRRTLTSLDPKFKKIELVYQPLNNNVSAIVWELSISLSQLTEIFGVPITHNEPYSDTTAFAFKSTNPNIEIIKTRHPEWLKKLRHKNSFAYQDKNNKKIELEDPIFSFVQFNLLD